MSDLVSAIDRISKLPPLSADAQRTLAAWRLETAAGLRDTTLIQGGLGTITGMVKGRHVMASKKQFPFVLPICRGKLQKVLNTYNGYSQRLKKAYTAGLKKRPDFSTLGYIYSDWAKDGFDGKQLTVTTYI